MPYFDPKTIYSSDEPTSSEEPGIAKQVGGGLLVGLRRDPIAGFFVNQIADLLPGVARTDIDKLESDLKGKTLAQISEFVGEWGSTIAIGAGAYTAGRVAGRAALRGLAPGITQLGPEHLLGRQSMQFLKRLSADVPGFKGFEKLLRPGGLERGAEIVGGALGVGSQGGTGTALQGGTLSDVAESFAVATLLTGALDGALYGIGRAISPRVKSGAYINKAGEIQGLEEAIQLKKRVASEFWAPIFTKTKEKLPIGDMKDKPFTEIIRANFESSQGALLQKRAAEYEKLLGVGRYERYLQDKEPFVRMPNKQGDLFKTDWTKNPHGERLFSEVKQPIGDPRYGGAVTHGPPKPGPKRFRDPNQPLKNTPGNQERLDAGYYGQMEQKTPITRIPPGMTKRQFALRKAIDLKRQQVGDLRSRILGKQKLLGNITIEDLHNTQKPYNPETLLGGIRSILAKVVENPFNLSKRMGQVMHRTLKAAETAESNSIMIKEGYTVSLKKRLDDIAVRVGVPVAKSTDRAYLTHYDEHLGPFFHTIEKEGYDVAVRKFGVEATGVGKSILDELAVLYEPLIALGAQPKITRAGLEEGFVKVWLPHVGKQGTKSMDELFDRAVETIMAEKKIGGVQITKLEAESRAAKIIYTDYEEGLKRWGSIDKSRDFSGSLLEQSEHFEMEGHVTGIFRHATETARRYEYARFFGLDGQNKDEILALAKREGADMAMAVQHLDFLLGRKYFAPAAVAWSRRIVNLQAVTKLTFATIPNLFQQLVNNPTSLGLKNTLKGASDPAIKHIPILNKFIKGISKLDENIVVKATALHEEYLSVFRQMHLGANPSSSGITDRLANWALKSNFFSASEKFNRMGTGVAALHRIREVAGKGIAGKIKGKNLDFARRQFASVGLDFDMIVDSGRKMLQHNAETNIDDVIRNVGGDFALERSIFNLVRETQFTPILTRTPMLWQTPYGRVLTQFKSFAFQQGIMVRDHIIGEAALGNMKPLAMATAMYPATGFAVHQTLESLKDKKRPTTQLGDFLSTISSVGGLGITSSIILSAYYGRLNDALVGPTLTDIGSFGQSILQDILDMDTEHTVKRVQSQPLFKATKLLVSGTGIALGELMKITEQFSDDSDDIEEVTFESLIKQRKQR